MTCTRRSLLFGVCAAAFAAGRVAPVWAAVPSAPRPASGPPLGFPWTIYIAYLIPPVLIIYVLLQGLRLAIRKSSRSDGTDTPV